MADHDKTLERHKAALWPLAQTIVDKMLAETERIGFSAEALTLQALSEAIFHLVPDPASGEDSLVGEWSDRNGIKVGTMIFHTDGSFFAEQDIIRPHPTDPRWFVEAVNAWGREGAIKVEARLLPAIQ